MEASFLEAAKAPIVPTSTSSVLPLSSKSGFLFCRTEVLRSDISREIFFRAAFAPSVLPAVSAADSAIESIAASWFFKRSYTCVNCRIFKAWKYCNPSSTFTSLLNHNFNRVGANLSFWAQVSLFLSIYYAKRTISSSILEVTDSLTVASPHLMYLWRSATNTMFSLSVPVALGYPICFYIIRSKIKL